MLNLTLASLIFTNTYSSSLFSLSNFNADFSHLSIRKSFSTGIFTGNPLRVTNSLFTDFLSTAVHLSDYRYNKFYSTVHSTQANKNANPASGLADFFTCGFIRCTASSSTNFNGGAIFFSFQSDERLQTSSCYFWYCDAPNLGGAIYSDSQTVRYLIQKSTFGNCAAQSGAAIYLGHGVSLELSSNYFDSSAPIRRSSQVDGCYISVDSTKSSLVNFSHCTSLTRCSAIYFDIKDEFAVKNYIFSGCAGVNTFGLYGFKQFTLEYFYLINNSIIKSNSIAGNIYIMGEYQFTWSYFAVSNYPLIGGAGLITFSHSYFDFHATLRKNAWFQSCYYLSYESISNVIYFEHFYNRVDAEAQGETDIPFFQDEAIISHDPNKANPPTPRTHGYAHNKNGQMALAGFFLSFLFLGCCIFAFFVLKRNRRHILKYLYNSYVYEYQWKIKGLNHKNEREELEKDHDDYDGNVPPEIFKGVEIPDTHLWDTDDGEGQMPQQDAFNADVEAILQQHEQDELEELMKSTPKKKKIKSKVSRQSSSSRIKEHE